MKMLKKTLLALAAACAMTPAAQATTYSCNGLVEQVFVESSGRAYIKFGGLGLFTFCNVNTTVDSIDPATCQAWLSTILTARGLNKTMSLYFDTATAANSSLTGCVAGDFSNATRRPYFLGFTA